MIGAGRYDGRYPLSTPLRSFAPMHHAPAYSLVGLRLRGVVHRGPVLFEDKSPFPERERETQPIGMRQNTDRTWVLSAPERTREKRPE
ncbi:MAG: hypothetical protein OHK0015_22400 [Chloroflexi bacterium OHK40]